MNHTEAKFLASIAGPVLSILVLLYLHYIEVTEKETSSTGSSGLLPTFTTVIWSAVILSAFAFGVALLIYLTHLGPITFDWSQLNLSITILSLGTVSLLMSAVALVVGTTYLLIQ